MIAVNFVIIIATFIGLSYLSRFFNHSTLWFAYYASTVESKDHSCLKFFSGILVDG